MKKLAAAIAVLVGAPLTALAVLVFAVMLFVPISVQKDNAGADEDIGSVPGLNPVLLLAYVKAAAGAPKSCQGMRWQILAGIAQIESSQAAGRTIAASGKVNPPIIGPALNGSGAGGNTTGIRDSDGGKWDGDSTWDRAVGVLQFIPTSWTLYTSGSFNGDGNGDGVADPHNVFDNAKAAVNHLCAGGKHDFSGSANLKLALFGYNHSNAYVDRVYNAIRSFDKYDITRSRRPGGQYGGNCDVDRDLPRKNPRSCKEAVDYAVSMVHKECIWYRMCLGATAVEYGWNVSGIASAIQQWHTLDRMGWSHPGDRDPPVGALLYWAGGTYGHIAIYIGGGKIVSNDIKRGGCMDIAEWDAPETQWGQRYLGWTEPYYPRGG